MGLSLRLFGWPRLERDGITFDVGLRRGLALLAFLAVNDGGRGRDTIAMLLWPEAGDSEARARLRRTLHRLNTVAGTRVVISSAGDALRLDPEIETDVGALRALVARGLPPPGTTSDGNARHALERAATLAGSTFLEGFSIPDNAVFDEWQLHQREDFERLRARVLGGLSTLAAAAGEYAVAIDAAHGLLRIDPLDESAYRRLMALYVKAERPIEALRQYESCRRRLEHELGVQPETATTALAATIGRDMPVTSAPRPYPETRYARSGDVHIAFQAIGSGPVDLVMIPGFVSHLERIWDDPALADFLKGLARSARLLLFDRRGVGLSDRVAYAPTLDETAADVIAVMDAAASGSAVILGISEGGPAGVVLAVQQPERVRGLLLWGTTARATRAPDYPRAVPHAVLRRWIDDLVAGWGGPAAIEAFAPGCADNAAVRDWWAALLRSGSSPGGVGRVLDAFMDIDVRPLLRDVRVPTLVMHRQGDQLIRCDAGRYLARHIAGARLVEVAGRDHWIWSEGQEEILAEITAFLAGLDPAAGNRPRLASGRRTDTQRGPDVQPVR